MDPTAAVAEIPRTFLLWPADLLNAAEYARIWFRIETRFLDRLRAHGIPEAAAGDLAGIYLPLAAWMHRQHSGQTLIVGVNGGQGSGKSTLADFLVLILEAAYGLRVAGFSIDDIYRTRAERERLARDVHPLLLTRGVPGTHDPELGLATLLALRAAGPKDVTALPSFDKALDERRPEPDWQRFRGRPDLVLFEGWCVGTVPEEDAALAEPVNALERDEDGDGRWRRFVNRQLHGAYRNLFALLDRLIFLEVPGMDSILEWRSLQERKLRWPGAATGGGDDLLDAAAMRRFVMHYERLTRHNLATLPERADLTLVLDPRHRCTAVRLR